MHSIFLYVLHQIPLFLISHLKAKQNQTITRKRPWSRSSGADRDMMLAITCRKGRQTDWSWQAWRQRWHLCSSVFQRVSSGWSADLLQHGQVSDGPALEGGSSVTLNLYELILLSFWSVNIGHLYKKREKWQISAHYLNRILIQSWFKECLDQHTDRISLNIILESCSHYICSFQLKLNDTMMRRAASFSITPQNTKATKPLIIYR